MVSRYVQICDNIIFAHQYHGSGRPEGYSKMKSPYQEPGFSSRLNTSWIDEAGLEEGRGGYSQSGRQDLRHDTPRPYFSIPTQYGASMSPSSPSMTHGESTNTQSISPPQASYQPTARNGSERMGYGVFDPNLEQGRAPRRASFSLSLLDRGDYTLPPLNIISS